MYQTAAVLISIGALVTALYGHPVSAWIPLGAAAAAAYTVYLIGKLKKWPDTAGLSLGGIEMLRELGHLYVIPDSEAFSSACNTLQYAGIIIGTAGALNDFKWGLGLTAVNWIILHHLVWSFSVERMSRRQFELAMSHQEVLAWLGGDASEKSGENSETEPELTGDHEETSETD